MGPSQAFHSRLDITGSLPNPSSHGFQTPQMQINRPAANGTATWHGNSGIAISGQNRPQHDDRGPHLIDIAIRSLAADGMAGIHCDFLLHLIEGYINIQTPHHIVHGENI